ncbi:hypothetical protein Tco_0343339 [Tanacetum coccineum]
MGDENPIRTLGDYSKPNHEGYRNAIELPEGNNVVPLRSNTIWLVQNGCSFHGLRSEDPNQHLKDFLKLVDSLDLDVANRERTCLRLFQFSLRDQASNWLEHLPARSISTWEDLTNQDLALYDNESWNDPRDFAKSVKDISLPQDVPSTSDRRLIELENQVQRLMEAHLAPKQHVQVNKITSSCEICSGPHDIQYCMENPEQAFIDYASSRNNEVGGRQFTTNLGPRNFKEATNAWKENPNFNWERTQSFTSPQKGLFSTHSSSYQAKLERTLSEFNSHQERRLSSLRAQLRRQQDDMIHKINILWKVFSEKFDDTSTHDTARDSMAYEDEVREEENVKPNETEYNDHEMTAKAEEKVEEESEEEFKEETKDETKEEEEDDPEYFDTFPTLEELGYHEWLLKNPRPPWIKANISTGDLNNVKFSCMISHFDKKKQAYLDIELPINEDTTSVIDHYLGSVVFEKPFMETTGLVYDKKEGTVLFEKDKENIVFKMPHKMEMLRHIDFMDIKTDCIPPFVIKSDEYDCKKTHYSDSLNVGPEYKHDESMCRAIRSLMNIKAIRNKEEVT